MPIDYDILTHPLPREFARWYPYDKTRVMLPESAHWLDSMQAVIRDQLPGLKHFFSTAKESSSGRYVGVAWMCLSESTPELGHFGWFLVEEKYRGQGIGSRVLDGSLSFFESQDVEVVMLPTRLSTKLARGMYSRRGFKDLVAERETGRCWMIRQPPRYFESYFVCDGQPSILEVSCGDYLALDFLLNHERTPSRLFPVELTGEKRAISFTRAAEWPRVSEMAIRREERMCGFIVAKELSDEVAADFYSPDDALQDIAVEYLIQEFGDRLSIVTALTDERKRSCLTRHGFAVTRTFQHRPFGKQSLEEFAVWNR